MFRTPPESKAGYDRAFSIGEKKIHNAQIV
jgi:hypothetical protein